MRYSTAHGGHRAIQDFATEQLLRKQVGRKEGRRGFFPHTCFASVTASECLFRLGVQALRKNMFYSLNYKLTVGLFSTLLSTESPNIS